MRNAIAVVVIACLILAVGIALDIAFTRWMARIEIEAQERERQTETILLEAPTAGRMVTPPQMDPATEPGGHGELPVEAAAPSPLPSRQDAAADSTAPADAPPHRELPWYLVPSQRALAHYLACEAPYAGVCLLYTSPSPRDTR